MLYFIEKTKCRITLVVSVAVTLILLPAVSVGAPNNAPSFTPGHEPTSSACNREYRFPDWAQNVTDNDGATSGLSFHVTDLTNGDIFSKRPHVSWPSKTLSYELKHDVPGGVTATVTAVLKDTSGTGQGGRDTSDPHSWNIYTESCEGDSVIAFDEDGDGISDGNEGGGVLDTDGDGIPDSRDTDSDNDGIYDIDENEDTDGDGIRDSEEVNGDNVSTDTDGDGLSDEFDLDDDNDGIIDTLEGSGLLDSDNDNLPDSLDLDSDNDGLSDLVESGCSLSALSFSEDGVLIGATGENGLVDLLETSIDSGIPISTPHDSDHDGKPDFQDANKGLFLTDTDRDGIVDEFDIDDDNDGIIDTFEGSGLIDTDNDTLPDTLDLDSDNDGLSDLIESGSDLSFLAYTEAGSLTGATGQNGMVDLLETSADSGIPTSFPIDSDGDGTANFQEIVSGLIGDDASSVLVNDSSSSGALLSTGLRGGGCALGGQAAVDPLLIFTGLFAFIYLWRRKVMSFLKPGALCS